MTLDNNIKRGTHNSWCIQLYTHIYIWNSMNIQDNIGNIALQYMYFYIIINLS